MSHAVADKRSAPAVPQRALAQRRLPKWAPRA